MPMVAKMCKIWFTLAVYFASQDQTDLPKVSYPYWHPVSKHWSIGPGTFIFLIQTTHSLSLTGPTVLNCR